MSIENHLKTGGELLEFKNKAGSSGNLELASDVPVVFEQLKIRRKHRFIICRLTDSLIEVESLGNRSTDFSAFREALPFTDCRFGIFDQEYKTHDGRICSKLWFISWLPNNSTPYNKMAYTSAKPKIRDALTGIFDAQAATLEELETVMGLREAADEDEEDFDF